ncbi:MAG TPA: hypothetical protein VFU23_09270, partial [Gemmatimonadales bacterium]|nr:hypothetical protein [Gemmatimonadales bacterium]
MAAGVTLRRERFEAFRDRFERVAAERLAPEDLGPEQRVDIEIPLALATDQLERLIRHLEPCGMGNPAPVFGVRGVGLTGRQRVGLNHLRGTLQGPDGTLGAIAFRMADRLGDLGEGPIDATFRLELNEFRGQTSLQARVLSLAPHGEAPGNGVAR